MAQPNFEKSLKEVLKHHTTPITKISPKTGNKYDTEAVQSLKVYSTGLVETVTKVGSPDQYKYSIVDPKNDLEYSIKTNDLINVKFGLVLEFFNVVGGATKTGCWFSADSVREVPKNE